MKIFKITLIVLLVMSLLGQIMMANDVAGAEPPGTFMILFILGSIAALSYSLSKNNKKEDNSEGD
jgi:hypothetical protein|tara:strand:+ start:1188 stop:1382 length:195 start_codon:yes stop_codon:yes gene_type:complete